MQVTDVTTYLQHCQQEKFEKGVLVLTATQELVAEGICKATDAMSRWLVEQGLKRVILYYPNCGGSPYEFDGSFAEGDSESDAPTTQSEEDDFLYIPELELDFNRLLHSPKPTYITQLNDQTNLFANTAALRAQGKKPKEFLGQSAYALNDKNELDYRCDRLAKNELLREYQYTAYRWYQEEGIWRLKTMEFHSNFRKIVYLDEECWLGQVLQATAV